MFAFREPRSAKTDHARNSGLNDSLRAAMNVFADPGSMAVDITRSCRSWQVPKVIAARASWTSAKGSDHQLSGGTRPISEVRLLEANLQAEATCDPRSLAVSFLIDAALRRPRPDSAPPTTYAEFKRFSVSDSTPAAHRRGGDCVRDWRIPIGAWSCFAARIAGQFRGSAWCLRLSCASRANPIRRHDGPR